MSQLKNAVNKQTWKQRHSSESFFILHHRNKGKRMDFSFLKRTSIKGLNANATYWTWRLNSILCLFLQFVPYEKPNAAAYRICTIYPDQQGAALLVSEVNPIACNLKRTSQSINSDFVTGDPCKIKQTTEASLTFHTCGSDAVCSLIGGSVVWFCLRRFVLLQDTLNWIAAGWSADVLLDSPSISIRMFMC